MLIAGEIYQLITTAESLEFITTDEYGEPIRKR